MFRGLIFFVPACTLQCALAGEPLVLQTVRSHQAFITTGTGLVAGGDLFVVGEGSEGTGAILLKVSEARFAGQTELSRPDDFQYFGNTGAVVPDGFVFEGINATGAAEVFQTDRTGGHVLHVGYPAVKSLTLFATDSELWIAGEGKDDLPIIGRLNADLALSSLHTLAQAGRARATQIAKYHDFYYVLTSGAPADRQTSLWKLSADQKVLSKSIIPGIGAIFAVTKQGLAVSYNKDAGPYVDFLNFDLKVERSTRLFSPQAGGARATIVAANDKVFIVGGNRNRMFVATLSNEGALIDLTYDDKNVLQPSLPGYAVIAVNDGLWIVGSFVEASKAANTDATITLFTYRSEPFRATAAPAAAKVKR